jgi:hypothetical protein
MMLHEREPMKRIRIIRNMGEEEMSFALKNANDSPLHLRPVLALYTTFEKNPRESRKQRP